MCAKIKISKNIPSTQPFSLIFALIGVTPKSKEGNAHEKLQGAS
jgi:hypothetical protein